MVLLWRSVALGGAQHAGADHRQERRHRDRGVSKNQRMDWWRQDGRRIIAWEPTDSADAYTPELDGKTSGNPVVERYQGGGYCGRTIPASAGAGRAV